MAAGMKAIDEFAKKISDKMVERGIVQKEDAALYQYGIGNGIVVAGNLLASAVFGILTGRLGVVLVFLLFYGSLRSYSGGVHCRSRAGCFILSMLVLSVPVFSYEWVMGNAALPAIVGVGVIAIVVVLVLSPVESINKPLDDEERKVYKRISHCIVVLQGCVLAFLYCMDIPEYFYAGYSSLIMVAAFMAAGKISTKRYI